ncbi:MAG: histidine kinase dimerization/phospho-acceptor domain-containing protein [Candidatus Binatia bacterium]
MVVAEAPPGADAFLRGDSPELRLARADAGDDLTVTVGVPATAALHATRRLRLLLLVGVPITLLLLSAALWSVISRALRPLEAAAEALEEIGVGDLAARLPQPARDDEVGRMVAAVNRMLQRLDTAVAQVRRLTADAAHELRTPIAVLRTGLEVALRRQREPAEYRAALADALHDSERLDRLAEDLLTLARLEALPPRPAAAIDLAETLQELADAFQGLAEQRGARLAVEADPGLAARHRCRSLPPVREPARQRPAPRARRRVRGGARRRTRRRRRDRHRRRWPRRARRGADARFRPLRPRAGQRRHRPRPRASPAPSPRPTAARSASPTAPAAAASRRSPSRSSPQARRRRSSACAQVRGNAAYFFFPLRGRQQVGEGAQAAALVHLAQRRLGLAPRRRLLRVALAPRRFDHGQADATLRLVDGLHGHLHRVADADHLAGVGDAAVERHLRHVHQAVQSRCDLDVGAEALQAPHRARHARADREALPDAAPGIGRQGAQRQRDAPRPPPSAGSTLSTLASTTWPGDSSSEGGRRARARSR